ncbi:hypothetical protein Pla175_41890 [Pirellulimonas nuda]|uniref:Uncharacterized protein n=1 Tax=Pirellulimonas nuda TaxID=2528009 RepID=A0A518DH31_9BACT|nr:hypothetical protein [Pirellulimonas nuda]QDU90776.1 hypothetical protein Pla175_41890 [Pirellulimonas nuda]
MESLCLKNVVCLAPEKLRRLTPAARLALVLGWALGPAALLAARPDGQLLVRVTDAESGAPIAARITLTNSRGRPALPRGAAVAQFADHGYVDGQTLLALKLGKYVFDLDAGPEWRTARGEFQIERHADDEKTVAMSRAVDLAKERWYGADVWGARTGEGLGVALRAEGLGYAPLIAFEQAGGRWRSTDAPAGAGPDFGPHAARLEGPSGALLVFRVDGPLTAEDLSGLDASVASLRGARARGLRVVVDPASWAFPAWLAGGVVDGVLVIDESSDRLGKGRRPADGRRFPGRRGAGRYREACYFSALDAGLRLPPFAGSGSGEAQTPLGAGRTYALLSGGWSTADWWRAALAGQTFITNGPLLRVSAPPESDGSLPSGASLATRNPIEYLEVVSNGRVTASVPIRELAENRGRLPEVDPSLGGWVVLRAATTAGDRYERAMTAPYYLDPPSDPAISRAACEAMLDWLRAAEAAGVDLGSDGPAAQAFWQQRRDSANRE